MGTRDALHTLELSRVLLEASSALRHDLRNRLGSIRNMAFFVKKRVKDGEAASKDPRIVSFLDSIDAEVERATALMESWSERVTSLHEHQPSRAQARAVVELAVQSARIEPGIELRVSCVDALLECDPLELALALRCLVENAAEAAPAAGVDLLARPSGQRYEFVVRDRGAGIAQPDTLLKRLESGKPGHLGLGLALCKRLMEAAGGGVEFRPAPGGAGSEVELSLPVPSASPRALAPEGTFGE